MGLRLFHITEFAQSMLSPAAQREAQHPALLLLLASLWLALAGNVPLWRELARLPMDGGQLLWIGLCFSLLTTAVLGALLSLLNWPWLLKAAITMLLCLSALNTALLWAGHSSLQASLQPAAWRLVLGQLHAISFWHLLPTFGVLALAPSLWLWQLQVRRLALTQRMSQNMLLLLAFTGLLAVLWLGSRQTLLPILQDQPRWLELLSPFNTLLSLRH